MLFRSRALRLLLAALLLFSQQQAVLHLLGHSVASLSPRQDSTDPQELVCARCLAIAHLDHAVSGSVPAIEPVATTPGPIVPAPVPHLDLAFFASYRSRAPPVLS